MPEALSGTMALVPQVVDAVDIPVIAAGGITDGRGLAAALALGAVAAQCGTAFLRADEAATSPSYRLALETAGSDNTMLTTAFSGRPARGIANRFSIEMDDANKRAPYPYQNALTRHLRSQASLAENAELLSLWAGQAFRLGRSAPAAEIIREMLTEAARSASATLHALQPPQGAGA
jgi:nitronate monooxygenase